MAPGYPPPSTPCRKCEKLRACVTANHALFCEKHRINKTQYKDDLVAANECLDMVREALENLGLDMNGTPPMMYDDAIRQVASILGRKAGLLTGLGIAGVVAEHEAARKRPHHEDHT